MLHERETRIGKVLNRLNDLPSLPKVVEKLLKLSDSGAGTREFADLIATDQGLSAKVLKLVNSAFYSLRAPVSSIRQASSLLGVRTLKSLALSVSVIQIFKKQFPGFDPIRFWRHALAVAMAGRKAAERMALPNQDEVYIVGLLHDTGVALMVQHFPADFAQAAAGGREGSPPELAREVELFGQAHPEVGFNLAGHWRLPPLVGLGIRYHHAFPEEIPPDVDPEARRLIAAVRFADSYARRSGHSFAEFDTLDPPESLPELPGVELDEEGVQALVGDLSEALAALECCFFDVKAEASPKR